MSDTITKERHFKDRDHEQYSISVELDDNGIMVLGNDTNPWYYGASGIGAILDPQTARDLAAHLIALADKLEGKS